MSPDQEARQKMAQPDHNMSGSMNEHHPEGTRADGVTRSTPGPQTPEAVDIERFTAQVAEARRETEDFKNRYLRAAAEVQNVRKQAERDASTRATQDKRRFLREFLEVGDSLEMALSLGDWPGMREGVRLAYQQLQHALAQAGVERMVVKPGDTFDPVYHEAVEVRAGDAPHDVVVEVVRAGYLHDGAVLRPAQVIVARGRNT
jgi:molecular chaperone GrpE